MSAGTFDRLNYLETLKRGGIAEGQARVHTMALDNALRDMVATKHDVMTLRHDLEILRRDLTIRLGAMMMALGGILIAIKYFG